MPKWGRSIFVKEVYFLDMVILAAWDLRRRSRLAPPVNFQGLASGGLDCGTRGRFCLLLLYYIFAVLYYIFGNREIFDPVPDIIKSHEISALKGIAGGKYKYVVSQTEATITHPYGEIRKKCVEEAQAFVSRANKEWTITECEKGFNLFMMRHAKELNHYLKEHHHEIIQKRSLDGIEKRENTIEDIMRLPDTNLIKQKLLEYGRE